MRKHREVMDAPFASHGIVDVMEDVDPMQSVANMADCMLVLACGLMLALVMYWKLDVSPAMQEVVEDTDLAEISSSIEDMETTMNSEGSGYEELGMVYRDPKTGKMYMMKRDVDGQ